MLKTLKPTEIARYCNVHRRTVSRWIASGELEGHKLPGRGNYRVLVADFITFLEKQNMPVPATLIGTKSVLLVDDDPLIRRSLKRALVRDEFTVHEAGGGVEAGMLLAKITPDFVVLDLSMPGVDGFEVIQLIKNESTLRQCKIIVLSGLPDSELRRAVAMGAACALAKPCQPSELIAKINQHAGNLNAR